MTAIRKRVWTTAKGERKTAWLVDYRDQAGKRRAKQFDRKKDAEGWNVTAAYQVVQGTHTHDRDSITIAAAGEMWLTACRAENLEPTTIAPYEQHLRLHITPICGTIKLSTLTTPKMEQIRDSLTAKLSRPMALRVLRSLKAIIGEAMRLGYVAQNVALPVKIKRQARSKLKPVIPPKQALRSILEAAGLSNNGMALPWHCLAIYGGLRSSELRGLPWSMIDLKAATVEIAQRADAAGRIGPPKTEAGRRTISLPQSAVVALTAWKLACPPSDMDLVFPSLAGVAMSYKYMIEHIVEPVQFAAELFAWEGEGDAALKVAIYTPHAFRHAAASLWIDQKVNAKRIQYLMGHSNIAVTFDTYGHLFEQVEKDEAVASAIETAIFADAT